MNKKINTGRSKLNFKPVNLKNSAVIKIWREKIGQKGQDFVENLPYKKLLLAFAILNLALIALIVVIQNHLPPEIPLFYGFPESEDQLAQSMWLTIPPIVALGITAVNAFISYILSDIFYKKILVITSFIATFFSTITVLKIIFLVGSF